MANVNQFVRKVHQRINDQPIALPIFHGLKVNVEHYYECYLKADSISISLFVKKRELLELFECPK